MASPQLENGYCSFATELVDNFCHYRLSGEEWLVLWSLFRKTYCWHKKEDNISLSQFSSMTGLPRPTVVRAIKKLLSKKILAVIKNDNTTSNLYRFNKDYITWKSVIKKDNRGGVIKKDNKSVIKKDNGVLSKKIHTIDTLTKEKKDRATTFFSDDDFLAFWRAYPRHEGKEKARQKFLKLDKSLLPLMLSAIEKQKTSKQWQDKEFIPHPATWINGKRWEDEVDKKTLEEEMKEYARECLRIHDKDLDDSLHDFTTKFKEDKISLEEAYKLLNTTII